MKTSRRSAVVAGAMLGAALWATAALATANGSARSAEIPFVDHGGIRDWQADGNDGLWVQDSRRHWYYARFLGPCHDIDFATSIGFVTAPGGTFDRFSSVIVPGWGRCALVSLKPSIGPAARLK